MSTERALTWSGKWHIVNPGADNPNRKCAMSWCGTYVYRDEDPHYPNHLTRIKDGTLKSKGDCKKCAQITGVRTPEQILTAVHELHQRWAESETWDGKPDIVSHAYAQQLAEALGIEETA
ncbi:hypothetical protein [Mycolicibacterium sp. XJ775]